MARIPENTIAYKPIFDGSDHLPALSCRISSDCLDNLRITMPRALGYTAMQKELQKYMDIPALQFIKKSTDTECMEIERVQRRVFASCGIPARHCGMTARNEVISEQSLSELLEEVEGKKEDNMDSLMDRKIKKVVIECEDGSTYEGVITRMEGNPYNLRSTIIEARVGSKLGNYDIKEVIFANPSTIVKWTDGTETVVSCMDNAKTIEKTINGKKVKKRKPMKSKNYSKEVGLAMCIAKKWAGNQGNFNNIFRQFIEGYTEDKA